MSPPSTTPSFMAAPRESILKVPGHTHPSMCGYHSTIFCGFQQRCVIQSSSIAVVLFVISLQPHTHRCSTTLYPKSKIHSCGATTTCLSPHLTSSHLFPPLLTASHIPLPNSEEYPDLLPAGMVFDCVGRAPCSTFVAVWAWGGRPFTFPHNIGYPIGPGYFTKFVLEVGAVRSSAVLCNAVGFSAFPHGLLRFSAVLCDAERCHPTPVTPQSARASLPNSSPSPPSVAVLQSHHTNTKTFFDINTVGLSLLFHPSPPSPFPLPLPSLSPPPPVPLPSPPRESLRCTMQILRVAAT
ncbi:unnamed protein product [Closterium sp. NIES-54]